MDLKAGEVRLDPGSTKNGEGRVFPFTAELRRVLEDQQKAAGLFRKAGVITPFVFFHTTGKKTGKRITESGFNKVWRKARVGAGCPGRIPHDFRRTAVRDLVHAGVPERVAMQLTGHKTRAVSVAVQNRQVLCDAALKFFEAERTVAIEGLVPRQKKYTEPVRHIGWPSPELVEYEGCDRVHPVVQLP